MQNEHISFKPNHPPKWPSHISSNNSNTANKYTTIKLYFIRQNNNNYVVDYNQSSLQ